ncbi:hypothetical protein [Micromonospora sp. WMMC273]|uniref:hypothetical protein n=1 Tax=Micromonospora sp. WMMC273 TaxID=3015157 RepID=UPI0022B6E647|nr:hypothetical protein [Micromonospora sp. WMMC273]MCZ7478928.1 hypothetical protein [Micromonospora sp. WMMC273]MCZ7478989.1 hypothetical protein [Micromonospora sp. WMMC273]
MTTDAPTCPPAPGAGLAELFVRLYRRLAARHDFDPGPPWPQMAPAQRALLTDVFADLELLHHPRITELRHGQTVLLILPDTGDPATLDQMRATVAEWLPDQQVYIAAGISHTITS